MHFYIHMCVYIDMCIYVLVNRSSKPPSRSISFADITCDASQSTSTSGVSPGQNRLKS